MNIYIIRQYTSTCDEPTEYYFLYKELAIVGIFNLISALVKTGYSITASVQNPKNDVLIHTELAYLIQRASMSTFVELELLQSTLGSRGVF